MSEPIESYAVIGDLHTVALVSKSGSIDWLCLPHFDSEACFASILGDDSNGHWTIAPTSNIEAVSRRYRPGTLVLETEISSEQGIIRVTDFMPIREHTSHHLPEIIRVIEGLEGDVDVRSELSLRFDYGRSKPFVRKLDEGIHALAGPDGVVVVSPAEVSLDDHKVTCDITVKPEERYVFQIVWHRSWEETPKASEHQDALEETTNLWRKWSEICTYEGKAREAIMRSLITLKSLTYWPSGGIVAAPTTSLPESIGGERNWDYRYCWLRDSSVTLEALNRCGYLEEAQAFRDWLLRAVAGDPSQMQIMYGISGERHLTESTVDWLPGYENSAPVRIGNAASDQFQLDVYGEVMDAQEYGRDKGIDASEEAWSLQLQFAEFVENHWQEPDDGIWEVRGGRQHFTYSKVMAWVAIDRTVQGIKKHGLPGDADHWQALAEVIRADILKKGVDPDRNCFTQYYGSKAMDASLLMIPQVGFLPMDDDRIINTIHAVEEDLSDNGFILRYKAEATDDGLKGSEGTFIMCSFWMVECLAMIGEVQKAQMLFDRLLDIRNDVGLLSEEYDTVHHRMLGNMPQAFSHVGLINAALALQDAGSPDAA
ncbi:MAG: glycoside hydrolase family 15 protein [Candidatus Nanopelagicales bacterium]